MGGHSVEFSDISDSSTIPPSMDIAYHSSLPISTVETPFNDPFGLDGAIAKHTLGLSHTSYILMIFANRYLSFR